MYGNESIVKYLLENGSYPDIPDNNGETALMQGIKWNKLKTYNSLRNLKLTNY